MTLAHWSRGALAGAATTGAVRRVLRHTPPGGAARWLRTNHRGEPISLLEGPAVALGIVVGSALSGAPRRRAVALALTTGASAAFGLVDDLAENPADAAKGLRGHLRAARHGRLTTGGLKVLGIGASGLLFAVLTTDRDSPLAARLADVAIDSALVAASANMVNLLDLRPGRALKLSAGVAAGLSPRAGTSGGAGAVLGAVASAVGADLREEDMLGDCGANALGALLGGLVTLDRSRAGRVAVLASLVALTLASERVSFSTVIAQTPWLNTLDMLGRRAPVAAAPVESSEA